MENNINKNVRLPLSYKLKRFRFKSENCILYYAAIVGISPFPPTREVLKQDETISRSFLLYRKYTLV